MAPRRAVKRNCEVSGVNRFLLGPLPPPTAYCSRTFTQVKQCAHTVFTIGLPHSTVPSSDAITMLSRPIIAMAGMECRRRCPSRTKKYPTIETPALCNLSSPKQHNRPSTPPCAATKRCSTSKHVVQRSKFYRSKRRTLQ